MNSPAKRRSGLAVTSLVLGLIGVWCVMVRAPVLLVLAVPLGVITMICGAIAAWMISRQKSIIIGKGMAITGVFLGSLSSVVSLFLLGAGVVQNVSQDRFNHEHGELRLDRNNRSSMRNESASNFTSNLPIIVLEAEDDHISKENRTVVRARVYDAGKGRAALSSKPDNDIWGTINARGHSTMGYPKQSLTFHTTDQRGQQVKVPLLGLPAEEDWVLYAPFEDKSLIRDVLAYELSRRMGHYAPRTRYVELFLKQRSRGDGKISMRDYMGVYVLVERIKRDKERVNIAKLDPQDNSEPSLSGGYIVKRDHGEGGGGRFRTERGGPYFYVYPKAQNISAEQKRWIKNYFEKFEDALYSDDFADPKTGYAAYLDVDAFIDLHWLIEMSKNVDGFRYSAFLTKDRGKKLKPGPAWDWNRAFGNANYYGGGTTRGWYWTQLRPNEISWHTRLRADPEYVKRAAARWAANRQGALETSKILDLIDQIASQLEEAQKRNFQRWPILGSQIASNYYVGESYREEVDWLKKWIEKRLNWMDAQIAEGKI